MCSIAHDASNHLGSYHWSTIQWYFQRVPVIEITRLTATRDSSPTADFDGFGRLVMDELSNDVAPTVFQTFAVRCADGDDDERNEDHRNAHAKAIVQIANVAQRTCKTRVRRDEPQLGAVIYFESIALWQRFVSRLPALRHPFTNPAGNYVFVLTNATAVRPDDGDYDEDDRFCSTVANVLEQLFHKHHILNAIFVSNGGADIAHYDPFYRADDGGSIDPAMPVDMVWGAVKWSRLATVDFRCAGILGVANDFRQYPIRAALF